MAGLILNQDDSNFGYGYSLGLVPDNLSREEMVKYIESHIERYKDTQLTDFEMSVGGRLAVYPSKVMESTVDMYYRKMQNGEPCDFTNTFVAGYREVFDVYKLDLFKIWIDKCREIGIKSWISIRINDVHDTLLKQSVLSPDFFFENMHLTRGAHHEHKDYYDGGWDFSKPEIYDRMVRFVAEACERYDSDGLNLDFQRESFCFSPGNEAEGREIMTRLMSDVRRIAKGKSVSVRVREGLETSFDLGFDVIEWARLGLVDRVIVTSRWSTTDCDLPIELWRRVLEPYNVEICGGIEILIREENKRRPLTFQSTETAYGCAYNIYASGADKCYLFNYMRIPGYDDVEEKTRYEGCRENNQYPLTEENYIEFLKNVGSMETLSRMPRRHLVTFRDALPFWESPMYQVPQTVHNDRYTNFRIRAGKTSDDAVVVIGVPNESFEPEKSVMFVNTNKVAFMGAINEKTCFTKSPLYAYKVSGDFLKNINTVEIVSCGEEFEIDHIEIRINCK